MEPHNQHNKHSTQSGSEPQVTLYSDLGVYPFWSRPTWVQIPVLPLGSWGQSPSLSFLKCKMER